MKTLTCSAACITRVIPQARNFCRGNKWRRRIFSPPSFSFFFLFSATIRHHRPFSIPDFVENLVEILFLDRNIDSISLSLFLCASQATDEEKISVLLFRFFNSTLPSSRILREPEILREKIILKEGILERIFQMIHTVNKISFMIDNVADNRIL